jgi:hypothetical protein
LLIVAVCIEMAIAMIYLILALRQHAARIANLIAVLVTIFFAVGGGSLTLHYIFFATVAVIILLYITTLFWFWR